MPFPKRTRTGRKIIKKRRGGNEGESGNGEEVESPKEDRKGKEGRGGEEETPAPDPAMEEKVDQILEEEGEVPDIAGKE